MRKFRKIVVDDVTFRWLFRYDDYDYIYPSYLLFLPAGIPRAEIRIVFRGVQDKFPLNEGLTAVKNGKYLQINLNQPGYVAELLRYCLQQVDFSKKPRWDFEGYTVLRAMGYQTLFDTHEML